MTQPQLIVIGGSAGAIPTVMEIARGLPPYFSVPICIVVHLQPDVRSILPMLLESSSGIPAKHPQAEEPLKPGHIYVAPPDQHMIIQGHHILLNRGPRENRSRPAIDPLFRTAATAFGPSVIAVLLSGYLDDGTAGLLAIKKAGGTVIIQDPQDTPYNDMPRRALEHVYPDYLLPHKDIAARLQSLTSASSLPLRPTEEVPPYPVIHDQEDAPGHVLPMNRKAKSKSSLDSALWSALQALNEKLVLHQELLRRAEQQHHVHAVRKYQKIIETTAMHIQLIKETLDHASEKLQP